MSKCLRKMTNFERSEEDYDGSTEGASQISLDMLIDHNNPV